MSIRQPRRRLALAMSAAGLAVAFLASGCGGASSDSGSTSSARDNAPAAAGGKNEAAPQDAGAGGAPNKEAATPGPAQAPNQQVPEQRSIIYTGTITVRVTKVDEAALRASAAATGSGGFVGGDERTSSGNHANAKLILRVPADKFTDVLNTLHDLGQEESRSVSTQDVTEQVADVDARLANAQASVDRVRALMARAQTIGEITSLESELSRREGDLESLKARKRKLDDLTALSTITLVLLGPDEPGPAPKKDETGFMAGLKGGWSAFLVSMEVLLTILGALVPWLIALGIPLTLVWWLARRSRRNRPARLVPAPAGGPVATYGLQPPATRVPAPSVAPRSPAGPPPPMVPPSPAGPGAPVGPVGPVGPPPRVVRAAETAAPPVEGAPAATAAGAPAVEAPAAPAPQRGSVEPAGPAVAAEAARPAEGADPEPPR